MLGICHSLRFFGREKGVCDKLQRHPLIYPIFPWPYFAGVSTSLARQDLHLVIPYEGTQPLHLRYSVVNGGDCTRVE
jgi:hypothetical protein